MKAIFLTEEIYKKNSRFFSENQINTICWFHVIPDEWSSGEKRYMNNYSSLYENHELDGFFDLITPEINENQRLGEIYFDDDKFIYEVLVLPEPTPEEIKEKEYQLYLKRKYDGEIAYLKLSAEFRLAKLSGIITEEAHSAIEEILTPVRNEVMFGQWKKGLSILELIGSAQIGSDLYDRLYLQISTYITENYN